MLQITVLVTDESSDLKFPTLLLVILLTSLLIRIQNYRAKSVIGVVCQSYEFQGNLIFHSSNRGGLIYSLLSYNRAVKVVLVRVAQNLNLYLFRTRTFKLSERL